MALSVGPRYVPHEEGAMYVMRRSREKLGKYIRAILVGSDMPWVDEVGADDLAEPV